MPSGNLWEFPSTEISRAQNFNADSRLYLKNLLVFTDFIRDLTNFIDNLLQNLDFVAVFNCFVLEALKELHNVLGLYDYLLSEIRSFLWSFVEFDQVRGACTSHKGKRISLMAALAAPP